MQDRLTDLKGFTVVDLEVGNTPLLKDKGFLTDFHGRVEAIGELIDNIRDQITVLEEKYKTSLNEFDVQQQAKNSKEIEELIDRIGVNSNDIRNRITKLKEETTTGKTAEKKIKSNVHAQTTKKFLDLMKEYMEMQKKWKETERKRIVSKYRIISPSATEEEIERKMEQEGNEVFIKELQNQNLKLKAAESLKFIQNKSNEIKRLEQSILELNGLFLDMAIMVEEQGNLLDIIENDVHISVVNTEVGKNNLKHALHSVKKSRKKTCILIVILLVILFVLAGGIGLLAGLVHS